MDVKALVQYFQKLDRALFLDSDYKHLAGVDGPLPIGHGQTISQPSLVLEMTRLLAPEPDSIVLEIGTGSGYQTALLARFSRHVYTIEWYPELSEAAQQRHQLLGLCNITYRIGDGSFGWAENAPYDRIMVTAAAGRVPDELVDQLKPGGAMVIPVGPPSWQELLHIQKAADGSTSAAVVESVRFVELRGKYGWG